MQPRFAPDMARTVSCEHYLVNREVCLAGRRRELLASVANGIGQGGAEAVSALWQCPHFEVLLAGVADQYRALFEPVPQHDAAGRVTVEGEVVDGGSVGVAVDHHPAVVGAQHLVDGGRGDIHDGLALDGFLHPALATDLVGDSLTAGQGQPQEQPAQPLELGDAAILLISLIPGAEQIAVTEQYPFAIEVDDARVPQQGHARLLGKLLAQHKVAVTVDKIDGHILLAQGQQGCRHLVMQRIGIIIANPEFEQIPQHIEGIGAGGVVLEKAHQCRGHIGPLGTQVNVTDKEGAHNVGFGLSVETGQTGVAEIVEKTRCEGCAAGVSAAASVDQRPSSFDGGCHDSSARLRPSSVSSAV